MVIIFWGLALLFYGVGDYLTTVIAVQYEDIEESMPVVRMLLGPNPSLLGFAFVKIIVLGGFYGGFVLLSGNSYRWMIPVAITAVGIFAVANNSYVYIRTQRGT